MKLTEEQKAVLGGERGALLARYLDWSILWGEALGATRLVPVTNVHCILRTPCLKGISERTLDTYLDEFRELCSHQVECITLTHANCTDLAALINLEADPPSVLGCVIAGVPVIQVEPADLNRIADGDWVEVDSDRETVRVYEPQ